MKDVMRLKSSLKEDVEKALNAQIAMEAYNSAHYLAMASWCDRNGYDNSAEYFYKQAEEEREHMLKIFRYVADMGGTAISPEVRNVPNDFTSFRDVFEKALEAEVETSLAINRLVDVCRKNHDYMTEKFLHWFLQEQIEEEFKARRALELFDVIGEEGVGRFMIDEEVTKIKYEG
ncbi:MAG: ferritin [Raineya sp.]|nr:ferritin [Raineya sp.]MDW8297291.1 ferritin [Raineya sp.]